jgi:hypothetical protein
MKWLNDFDYSLEQGSSKARRLIESWDDKTLIKVSEFTYIPTSSIESINIVNRTPYNVTFNYRTGKIIKVEDYDKV